MSIDTSKLKDQIGQLNALADKAIEKLRATESLIAFVNTHVPAYVVLPCGVRFGWDWCAGAWRLTHVGDDGKVMPIKDAARRTRIEAAAAIQELLTEVEDETDAWIKNNGG